MSTAVPSTTLRRRPEDGPIAGVCAGLGHALGIDPLLLRVGFVIAAASGGIGVVAYAATWMLIPAEGEQPAAAGGRPGRPGTVRVALGIGCLTLAALLLLRHLGLWFGDALVWPVALAATGAALVWRQSQRRAAAEDPAAPDRPYETLSATAASGPAAVAADSSRTFVGGTLIVGGALVFLWLTGALADARDVVLGVVVVLAAGGLLLAPWWVRLVRNLAAERAERIRSQERAEVAAHLHDSVLQTLALVQKRADDPRAVATLARRQERELRAWLNGAAPDAQAATLGAALERAAAEIEERHGVVVDAVTVGDRPLDEPAEALVAATREALTNAAKFAPDHPVSLYAEASEEGARVYVRDRGAGFDLSAVPADRRGVRESIIGRMERHGGRAHVHSSPGGTEVELEL